VETEQVFIPGMRALDRRAHSRAHKR
jgi:hypothetical protein